MKRAALAVLIALGLVGTFLVLRPQQEARLLERTNAARIAHHLVPLKGAPRISEFAMRHAAKLAEARHLFHSDLGFPKPRDWHVAGENIAAVYKLGDVVKVWMNSPPHRDNILRPVYRRVGFGAVWDGEVWWVVADYVG